MRSAAPFHPNPTPEILEARAHNERWTKVKEAGHLAGEERFLGVITKEKVKKGGVVVRGVAAAVLPERTCYTIQKGEDHVDVESPAFRINHSCDPTTGMRDNELGLYDFVALRDLDAGEQVTCDYDSCELESIAVRKCRCGADECRREIKGFKSRPREVFEQFHPIGLLPSHLANWFKDNVE